ncbi:MAG: hypothetical protein AAF532_00450 [Planctomycetota bacterium]
MKYSALSLATLATLVGCGGNPDGIQFASVAGTVVINGEPAEGIQVTFEPAAPADQIIVGPSSTGVTDAEGRFTLRTTSGTVRPAAVVGEHNVTLRIFREFSQDEETGAVTENQPSPYALSREQQSGYKYTVPSSGTDEAVFSIDGVKRAGEK